MACMQLGGSLLLLRFGGLLLTWGFGGKSASNWHLNCCFFFYLLLLNLVVCAFLLLCYCFVWYVTTCVVFCVDSICHQIRSEEIWYKTIDRSRQKDKSMRFLSLVAIIWHLRQRIVFVLQFRRRFIRMKNKKTKNKQTFENVSIQFAFFLNQISYSNC